MEKGKAQLGESMKSPIKIVQGLAKDSPGAESGSLSVFLWSVVKNSLPLFKWLKKNSEEDNMKFKFQCHK